MTNPLAVIPEGARKILYLVYALAGPLLVWSQSKGWTGDAEYSLWIGLGTAVGLVALSNTPATPSPRVAQNVVIVPDKALPPEGDDPEGHRLTGYGSGV
jgi:hypothetical protein